MQSTYSFNALDEVISVKLNPLKNPLDQLSEIEITIIERSLQIEFKNIQTSLIEQVFQTSKDEKIRFLINFYHDQMITMTNKVYSHRAFFPMSHKVLYHAYTEVIGGLDELLSFIELRFPNYINVSKNAPVTYLIVAKNELGLKINDLSANLQVVEPTLSCARLIFKEIQNFIDTPLEDGPVTFKEVLYMKELVSQLLFLNDPENTDDTFTALTEVLISLNFNSKAFFKELTQHIATQTRQLSSSELKLQQLIFMRREISDMYEKPGFCFNPQLQGIKSQIDRWFTHEIFYVEQEIKVPEVSNHNTSKPVQSKVREKFKILCILTGDQIGLILRALVQNMVIIAPNMKAVFEAIVPFLSTKEKTDLSPGNTRSKSYDAAHHDKQRVIEVLQKIIKTVSEF